MKSGWCGQLGRPACDRCRSERCDCPCHMGGIVALRPVNKVDHNGVIRDTIEAARTGERELTSPGLAPVLSKQNERLTAS